ncbi:hypothetical protein [Antiquaquibacter soli]|uniref:Uncharacterized protein n=1 Tax=Antiquaquibacter soli TaxID=3064523 RepID=A0ABT9BI54_9MICO|nr:hypothetical protein [Protaetiibacter sp. WY-16]MDO7880711.1 hypothetical protein [Protaetiibacter sp. WY-16]
MKFWFWGLGAIAVLLTVLSVALTTAGVSLSVNTVRARNVDLVVLMGGIGVSLVITWIVMAGFALPLVASLRRVRQQYPADLVTMAQRVTKESPFRRVGPIADFPAYFIVACSDGELRFIDAGSRQFLRIDAEQVAQVGVGSTMVGWRTWSTVRLDARSGGCLEFIPSREGDVLVPLPTEASVRELADRIRLGLGTPTAVDVRW